MKRCLTMLLILCLMLSLNACIVITDPNATSGAGSDPVSTTKGNEPAPETTAPATTAEAATQGEKQALKKAQSYLNVLPFSYEGLIAQLEFDKFTKEEATYGADHCGADWNEQALKKAKSYLDIMAFSHKGLVAQLEFDQFTTEQATYAADNCGADWNEQAAKKAKSYLDVMSFSKEGLIDQLEFDGFTTEQAEYGVKENGF